jgi:recombination protein RecA
MAKPAKEITTSTITPNSKARDIALAEIEKMYGKGAIFRMNNATLTDVYPCYGTGILSVDLALGQSIPKGRIIEVYGPESSGKTTLTLHIAAEVQRNGGTVAFIDAEHALDMSYARKLGVVVDDIDVSQPDSGEQGLQICDMLVKSGAYNLIIVDSVAALTPQKELDGDMGDSHMGLQARMMSQALRKLTGSISRSDCTVIFINQLRMKIGVMFGNPETTTGGNALKFYASQRIDIRRMEQVKVGDEVVANKVKIKIVKNKMAPPARECIVDLVYNEGFEPSGDILDRAEEYGVVAKGGAWYSYKTHKWQGRNAGKEALKADPALMAELRSAVLHVIKTGELPA